MNAEVRGHEEEVDETLDVDPEEAMSLTVGEIVVAGLEGSRTLVATEFFCRLSDAAQLRAYPRQQDD